MNALTRLAAACGLAALCGALHTQLTYQLSPDYYHLYRFIQLDIPASLHGPLGAAIVGARATWWIGLLISLPIAMSALFQNRAMVGPQVFWKTFGLVMFLTFATGAFALMLSQLWQTETRLWVPEPLIGDSAAWFLHVGHMYNGALLGGAVALLAGITLAITSHRQSRHL